MVNGAGVLIFLIGIGLTLVEASEVECGKVNELCEIKVRVHGERSLPVLVYLPGLHGDWTLVTSFREKAKEHFCFVEFTYPRTVEWTLAQYAEAVLEKLEEKNFSRGWILAESFSSQVAWEMLRGPGKFEAQGLILAGGFTVHPFMTLVRMGGWLFEVAPYSFWKAGFVIYGLYAKFRHWQAPETKVTVREFIARRTPEDFRAMRARVRLIEKNDPRAVALSLRVPIYAVAGWLDPIVPWWRVNRWLRRNCATFKDEKVIYGADHTVLATAPVEALEWIRKWVGIGERPNDKALMTRAGKSIEFH